MAHCVPYVHSSNKQEIKEVVFQNFTEISLTIHGNIHGSYCNKRLVYVLHPIYIKISFEEKVLIACIVSSMR